MGFEPSFEWGWGVGGDAELRGYPLLYHLPEKSSWKGAGGEVPLAVSLPSAPLLFSAFYRQGSSPVH